MSYLFNEISNLCYSYAETLDTGDHEAVGRLFEHGEVLCFYDPPTTTARPAIIDGTGRPNVGPKAIKQFYDEMVKMYDGKPRTRHIITNLIIDVGSDEKSASVKSYFQVVLEAPSVPLQIIVSGRYHDSVALINGKWRFTRKIIRGDYFGEVGKHARIT